MKLFTSRAVRRTHVYFPTSSSRVLLLYTMINGVTAEMGLVGNEGVVGIALFMGGDTTPNRAVVQGAGKALEVKSEGAAYRVQPWGRIFNCSLLRYTQALITQIHETAVCNRLHSVEQRLCRWLLMTHDRTQSDELEMTHEFISHMLGVRREGVTHAAQKSTGAGHDQLRAGPHYDSRSAAVGSPPFASVTKW